MAIHIDPRPFSGGAVVFNTQPSVNFYAQLLAKKQAKEEAIGNYVRDLNTKVTPAGVRMNDLPGWKKKYDDWFSKGQSNWQQIVKDPVLRANYVAEGQGLMNMANQSKAAEMHMKAFNDITLDPKKSSLITEDAMKAAQVANGRMFDENGNPDPNYKPFDYSAHIYDPSQVDIGKHFHSLFADMKPEVKEGDVIKRNPITGTATVSYTKGLSPTQIEAAASMAARKVDTDKSLLKYYTNRLETMPVEEHQKLNDIYKSFIGATQTKVRPDGKIIENEDFIGDDPHKLAMAEAIQYAKGLEGSGTKEKSDYQQKQKDRYNYAAWNSNLISSRQKTSGARNLADYDILGKDEYKSKFKKSTTNPSLTIIDASDISARDKDLFGKNTEPYYDPKTKRSYYVVKENGDWEGDDGQVIPRSDVARSNMDRISLSEEKRGITSPNIVPNQNPATGGMVTVILADGRQGQIPSAKVAAFLKENKGSKRK